MHLFWLIFFFVFALGGCVGSFLNVVAYRLPEGKSIVRPSSACPKCGHGLSWYDNIPVLSWLWLRGRCRYCKEPISIQYPFVEALTALAFGALYVAYYATDLRWAFGHVPATLAGDDFFKGSWLVFLVHLFLLGSLIAATLIDARFYIIPLSIPYLVSVVALVLLPAASLLGLLPDNPGQVLNAQQAADVLVPLTSGMGLAGAAGGALGLIVSLFLLKVGVVPASFADEHEYLSDAGDETVAEVVAAYPHPRREMLKELVFVGFPFLGLLIGIYLGHMLNLDAKLADLPGWVFVLGGVMCGYLTGAGLVWFTRIFGTLLFGKEAMGLGDVHLLAAVGAVLGPIDTTLAFFVAPFMGLTIYAILLITGGRKNEPIRMIPYGPFLAAGAFVVMLFRNELLFILGL